MTDYEELQTRAKTYFVGYDPKVEIGENYAITIRIQNGVLGGDSFCLEKGKVIYEAVADGKVYLKAEDIERYIWMLDTGLELMRLIKDDIDYGRVDPVEAYKQYKQEMTSQDIANDPETMAKALDCIYKLSKSIEKLQEANTKLKGRELVDVPYRYADGTPVNLI